MSNQTVPDIEKIFAGAEKLREAEKNEEALKEYTKVVYLAPRHWPSFFHLGCLFGEAGKHLIAIAMLRRAAEINPTNAVVRNHLADYLIKTGDMDEAEVQLKKSWELDPSGGNISAMLKIGKLYWERNLVREAIPYYEAVINCADDTSHDAEDRKVVARWFRGLCYMAQRDYQSAWPDYEQRNRIPGVIVPLPEGELWTGQPLEGKRIFLAYEQRFGDLIQFARFLPRLFKMGAKVSAHVPPELERTMRDSFPEVERIPLDATPSEYDYYHYLTSIPAVLNLDIDEMEKDNGPYVRAKPDGKTYQLPQRPDTALRVGLVWQGNPEPDRSIPLKKYIPLLKHRAVSFYSFQLGERRKDLTDNAVGWLIHDLAPQISDFHDSSILLQHMDLLITIDTAICHQAGGMGMPVWLMLKHFSDWRWELDRDDSGWYPTMRLFRQTEPGSWDEAARQLEAAFDEWVMKTLFARASKKAAQ